jgi:ABC-type spermidine/putrescine transport system permease subunit II
VKIRRGHDCVNETIHLFIVCLFGILLYAPINFIYSLSLVDGNNIKKFKN